MMMRRIQRFSLVCTTLLAVLVGVSAEIIAPGDYQGYFAKDRWGREIFYNGPGVLFVGDSVASKLSKYQGKPLEITVTEMHQPMNPGAAMIKAVDTVKVLPESAKIGLKAGKSKVTEGQGVKLHLTLRNERKEKLDITDHRAFIVLMTDSPQTKRPPNFKDPAGRAFWYHQEVYWGPRLERLFAFGCRQIPVDPQKLSDEVREVPSGMAPSGMEWVVTLDPKESAQGDFVVGTELVPGKYMAYAWFEDVSGFASSGLVGFEVENR